MYYYLYDSFLSDKKYAQTIAKIENRLIDLGINGKVEKMSVLKSVKEVVDDNIKNGADTIIAVGSDKTFTKIFPAVANQSGVTFGYIPMENSNIAKMLGIPVAEKACDVLSARIIEKIDIGKVNDQYFLSTLEVPEASNVSLECNGGHFNISSISKSDHIQICNLSYAPIDTERHKNVCNPKDGYLEAVFTPKEKSAFGKDKLATKKQSVFPIRKMKIVSDDIVSLVADGETIVKTPATVEVLGKRLNIIVGKERKF
ncbi:MAG: diacylglycerol kinase family protein [Patescibacteria group bacterium]|jgi:diacylglycerol kinase family enzyme